MNVHPEVGLATHHRSGSPVRFGRRNTDQGGDGGRRETERPVTSVAVAHARLFELVENPSNVLLSLTLPFDGRLELVVKH